MALWSTKKTNKYHAIPVEVDSMRFDSKMEAKYYNTLKMAVRAGEVIYFLRQVPLHLPGNVTYRCDFQIFWVNGTVTYIDVKGRDTPMSRLKRKQVEALYPIKIELVGKGDLVRRITQHSVVALSDSN